MQNQYKTYWLNMYLMFTLLAVLLLSSCSINEASEDQNSNFIIAYSYKQDNCKVKCHDVNNLKAITFKIFKDSIYGKFEFYNRIDSLRIYHPQLKTPNYLEYYWQFIVLHPNEPKTETWISIDYMEDSLDVEYIPFDSTHIKIRKPGSSIELVSDEVYKQTLQVEPQSLQYYRKYDKVVFSDMWKNAGVFAGVYAHNGEYHIDTLYEMK